MDAGAAGACGAAADPLSGPDFFCVASVSCVTTGGRQARRIALPVPLDLVGRITRLRNDGHTPFMKSGPLWQAQARATAPEQTMMPRNRGGEGKNAAIGPRKRAAAALGTAYPA